MKKVLMVSFILGGNIFFNHLLAQATSAKNTTDKNGKQCSSVGFGKDKQQAEKNREKAEKGAKEKGHDSFSGGNGGGAAGCRK